MSRSPALDQPGPRRHDPDARPLRRLSAALLLALAGCSGTPPPEPPPSLPAAGPIRIPPVLPPAEPVAATSFCDELRRTAQADPAGATPIAFGPADDALGAAVGGACGALLPGDADLLRPSFRCAGPVVPAADTEWLTARFTDLRSEIGACLAGSDGLDAWEEAPVVDFVGPERQALWQDAASWPRRIVVLRVEPAGDPVRPDYRLALEATRSSGRRVW